MGRVLVLLCAVVGAFGCVDNCSGHGACVGGACSCEVGWRGGRCHVEICDPPCEHGRCAEGACHCDVDTARGLQWMGDTCTWSCPVNATTLAVCNGHGHCEEPHVDLPGAGSLKWTASCECDEGYFGEECGDPGCAVWCENGDCSDDLTCACKPGWTGKRCDDRACPAVGGVSCSGHGACDQRTGLCRCEPGWLGGDCGSTHCPRTPEDPAAGPECSGHGACPVFNPSKCECHPSYAGDFCEQQLSALAGMRGELERDAAAFGREEEAREMLRALGERHLATRRRRHTRETDV